jgi:hypothetical protein
MDHKEREALIPIRHVLHVIAEESSDPQSQAAAESGRNLLDMLLKTGKPSLRAKWMRMTCSGCPTQFEGEAETGESLYIRYRWGYLELRVGGIGAVYSEDIAGDGISGVLTEAQVREQLKGVLDWPEGLPQSA